ncbi:hypothetical protein TSYNT_7285 [Tepidanaerobacter syntrophicus]|uniref:Uncharacterized protein n=1 Tax=Tepidanaerobacter syntrophicus TaxID=224999 RepID=A0A0U9HEL7_9FIRM|nr:hypothetical protein TSYNT_7285 [Tepidanaerobacter syntrophicus]
MFNTYPCSYSYCIVYKAVEVINEFVIRVVFHVFYKFQEKQGVYWKVGLPILLYNTENDVSSILHNILFIEYRSLKLVKFSFYF